MFHVFIKWTNLQLESERTTATHKSTQWDEKNRDEMGNAVRCLQGLVSYGKEIQSFEHSDDKAMKDFREGLI